MNAFETLKKPKPLPSVGSGFETATFDLKATIDPSKPFHLAKDVAAFANHWGGTLIIGASQTKSGVINAYVPLTEVQINEYQNAFSKAVTTHCSPTPIIDFERYQRDDGNFALAVNVWPYIGQAVGVKVKADKESGYNGNAYVFPVRSGADSIFLLPDQLIMYSIPELRRKTIILQQISNLSCVTLDSCFAMSDGKPTCRVNCRIQKIDAEQNYLKISFIKKDLVERLRLEAPTEGIDARILYLSVPIDAVNFAWNENEIGRLSIFGCIYVSRPAPTGDRTIMWSHI